MDETVIVLPSARAIRYAQLHTEQETLFLPNYITMSEFISKLTYVPGYRNIDDEMRLILLLEAANFHSFEKLKIDRNFFTFTKNSNFIFNFFEELAGELVAIEKLESADLYGEYEEHIAILQQLYYNYQKLCDENKLLDKIFLSKLYKFNSSFVKQYSKITIKLDGYLTNFEMELLFLAAKYCEVFVEFQASMFNIKMQEKLREQGFKIETQGLYLLNFTKKKVESFTVKKERAEVSCISFSEELLQVAFVKKKIYEFIKKGYDPNKIAVVLPNESSAKLLRIFDTKANLNFAMGIPLQESLLLKQIEAARAYLDDKTKQNEARLNHLGEDAYVILSPNYKALVRESDFISTMKALGELSDNKREKEIYLKVLHNFSSILPFIQEITCKMALSLFLRRLYAESLDDIRGGKITVMGVLETRAIEFDAVIIIDFDEHSVPRRSNKDMFLNTQLRKISGLPTLNDRENLQKHYYEMLLLNARESAICFVESEQKSGSRFLKELAIEINQSKFEKSYSDILFTSQKRNIFIEDEIIEAYSFQNSELSASKLKIFLSCKRAFYYKYIRKIKEHDIPQDTPPEHAIGESIHRALCKLYQKKKSYDSVDELYKDLQYELDALICESELEHYLVSLYKKRLWGFCQNEVERFNAGWSVLSVEKAYEREYRGINLIGRVDRVDKRENFIELLDYKTGSYKTYTKNSLENAVDFQLEFYALLSASEGNLDRCGFYDLKEGKIVYEPLFNEKMALLESHLADLLLIEEINFQKCEDTSHCTFCPYKIICGRK
jgi:RecB family exonuclease